MGLKKEGIDSFLLEVLLKLQDEEKFNDYALVGGTALSLQIGHRISTDIDLFTYLRQKLRTWRWYETTQY